MKKKKFKVTTKVPHIQDPDFDSQLNLFDLDSPDIGLFNMVDDELIRISGSRFKIYKYMRTDEVTDPVYMEDRNKTVSKVPIEVYGHYEPKVMEEKLEKFGIEITNDQLFMFNKKYIEQKLGRTIIPGDVIEPIFQKIKYLVSEVQEEGFEAYGIYHLACTAQILRDSSDVQDMQINPDHDPMQGYFDVGPK